MTPREPIFIGDRLILYPDRGTVDVVFQARPFLQDATAQVHYVVHGHGRTLSLRDAGPQGVGYGVGREVVSLGCADGHLRLDWYLQPDEEILRLWLEVTNIGSAPVYLHELQVLRLDAALGSRIGLDVPPTRWSFYQNGWQSWTPTFARHVGNRHHLDPQTPAYRVMHQPHAPDATLTSEWVTVIADRDAPSGQQSALLVGFVTAADQLAEVRLKMDGNRWACLAATCHLDGIPLAPGARLCSELLIVNAGHDPVLLLEDYGDRLGQRMAARIDGHPPTGWCTWYYFYGMNTAADVTANVRAIERAGLPLQVILIDDGYQTAIGDWLSVEEEKFPQGMAALAEEVRAAGHRPGIWTAPFGAAADSQLATAHPDWLITDETGAPVVAWEHWGTPIHALDVSHPEVQSWLEETFRTLHHEWGYEFFKIDFIFAAAVPGCRHDSTWTRAQALRRGVEIIRRAIGEDAYLLGCGAPLGPCVGLVDAMRIGPDVDPNWYPIWADRSHPATANALRNTLARAWMHNRLWANDPDCLLVRPRGDESALVLNEMRTLVTVIGLTGGLVISSDNLPTLPKGRLRYLRQVLPPTGHCARPLDLFQHELPRLLVLPIEQDWGRWWVVGLLNWEDHTVSTQVFLADLGLPEGRYHVFNFWRQRYLGMVDERLALPRHQPHETILLLLKPVDDEPQLLTSTFHVTQGLAEIKTVERESIGDALTLRVHMRKAGKQFGHLFFTVPSGWQVKEARVNGRRRQPVSVAQGVVRLGLTLEERAKVEVKFLT